MTPSLRARPSSARRGACVAWAATLWCCALTTPAAAHFVLVAPDAVKTQDSLGSPQKAPPCGEESGGTLTDKVTSYQPGDTVTISVNETIYHPGHYRVSLATDRADLPEEPEVTAGSSACGSVPIDPHPVFPVLADGLLVHTAPFSGMQTMTVTLPPDYTCTKCTLQIIEFMSDHGLNNPGGCFYHHCADLSIQGPTSTNTADSGSGTTLDSGLAAQRDAGSPTVLGRLDAGPVGAAPDAGHAAGARNDAATSTDTEAPRSADDGSGCNVASSGTSDRTDGLLVALTWIAALAYRRSRARAHGLRPFGRNT